MNSSIPSPPEVDITTVAGVFLLRLPRDRAEGYVRRHPGTRIADAPPACDAGRHDAIDRRVTLTHTEPAANAPRASCELALAA